MTRPPAAAPQPTACNSSFGLCGEVPWKDHYITAFEGFNTYNSSVRFDGRQDAPGGPPNNTAPVRNGTVVYAMDRTKSVSYADAVEECR